MDGNDTEPVKGHSRHLGSVDPNFTVAVVIPTKDRPELLEEAICSALNQSHPPTEIVVVDDGSAVPVDGARLVQDYGRTLRVVRNEQSLGLAYSRNRGVEEATAEYIVHLDDDDLLATDATAECLSLFSEFPEVELVFFAAEGFGPNAEHFNRVQPEGIKRVVNLSAGAEIRPHILLLGRDLFPALLRTVPIAFQRVMVRKEKWKTISEMRWRVYCLDPAVRDNDAARLKISGPLRDSEWALYASCVCRKTFLVDRPLYLQRCQGQGYSSRPSNRKVHMVQKLEVIKHLVLASQNLVEFAEWKQQIRDASAQSCFNAAYQLHHAGDSASAWRFLKQAMATRMRLRHLRLAGRMCLQHGVTIKTRW